MSTDILLSPMARYEMDLGGNWEERVAEFERKTKEYWDTVIYSKSLFTDNNRIKFIITDDLTLTITDNNRDGYEYYGPYWCREINLEKAKALQYNDNEKAEKVFAEIEEIIGNKETE